MPSHHAQADVDRAKQHARQRVWTLLDRAGVTLHRASVSGKIPNFVGADAAADQLAALSAWRSATVVKVNPDKVSRFPSELATTVHPLQIIDEPLPEAAHDFRVHLIVTTDETISCRPSPAAVRALLWERLDGETGSPPSQRWPPAVPDDVRGGRPHLGVLPPRCQGSDVVPRARMALRASISPTWPKLPWRTALSRA
jgi:hypothetical protein